MKNNSAEYLRALADQERNKGQDRLAGKLGDIADRFDKLVLASHALVESVTEKVFDVTWGREVGTSVGAREMNKEIDAMATELDEFLHELATTL